jgi:DNA-binding Lrp family transcriptional regulator
MLQERVIERFVLEVNPIQFDYKMIYLLIPGHDTKLNDDTLYDIINLVGDVIFQATCIGQMNVFCVLVKNDDSYERKIQHLESLIKFVRILGVVKSGVVKRTNSTTHTPTLRMMETDYKIIRVLIEDPRTKVDELANRINVASKTVSRRLEKLIENKVIQFGILVNPTRFRGYIPFHILVHTDHNALRKLLDDVSKEFDQYFFGYPEINPTLNIIILDMYSTNIYELDELYKKIGSSSGVKEADLLIPTKIRISHKWLLGQLETKLQHS